MRANSTRVLELEAEKAALLDQHASECIESYEAGREYEAALHQPREGASDCPVCDGIDSACGQPCQSAADVPAALRRACSRCEQKDGCTAAECRYSSDF
jgi:hypothetical protein